MYTNKKKIKRLETLRTLAWIMILISLIGLLFKDYHNFISFEALGEFLDSIIIMGIGIFALVSSNKNLKVIKDIEFSLNDDQFIYKQSDHEVIFNSDQPANILKKH